MLTQLRGVSTESNNELRNLYALRARLAAIDVGPPLPSIKTSKKEIVPRENKQKIDSNIEVRREEMVLTPRPPERPRKGTSSNAFKCLLRDKRLG